jgi:hypothetical protein
MASVGWSTYLAHSGRSSSCIGGQGAVPKEQNTQQSPGFGRNKVPRPAHSSMNWPVSIDIVSIFDVPQDGQVTMD